MRLTHCPLLLLFAVTGLAQTPQLVQQATNSGALLSSLTVTLPHPPVAGNLLVICHDSTSSGTSSVSGGGVSTWILCQTTVPTRDNSSVWAGFVDGAHTSIQLVLGGSPNDAAAVVTEWRGFTAPLQFASTFASGIGGTAFSPATSGTVTANAGDLVVAMIGTHSTDQVIGAPGNDFFDLPRPTSRPSSVMAAAWRIPSADGGYSTNWIFNSPSVWGGVAVAFRAPHPGSWGGSGDDIATQLRVDPAGGSVVAGKTTSFGRGSDFLLARFDHNGNSLSAMSWGGDQDEEVRGLHIQTGAAPGIYLTGASNSFGTSTAERDVVLVRCDLAGDLQWGARWSSNNNRDERGEAVVVDAAGNAFVAGTIRTPARADEVLLLKFEPVASGSQPTVAPTVAVWGSSSGDEGIEAAALDAAPVSPRLYVAGSTTSFGNGNRDVLVQRYDTDLGLQWTRTWGGSGEDQASGAAIDAQGNLYVAGSTQTGAAPADALLLKWNAEGTLLWRVTFGGAAADSLRTVQVDCFGKLLVAGRTASAGAGQQDGLLAKLDADGNLLWAQTWGGTGVDELAGAAVSNCADLILAGSSTAGASFAVWSSPTVQRSTSTALVTSPSNTVGTSPAGQLQLPTIPTPSAPGLAQATDVHVQSLLGATAVVAPGCAAVPTTAGGPVISFDSAPVLGGTVAIRRTSTGATPVTALLLGTQVGPQPLSVFGGTVPDATWCVDPWFGSAVLAGTSPSLHALPVPLLLDLYGATLDVQWIDFPELGNSAVGHLRAGW